MSSNFQFAFLGWQNIYLASVTTIGSTSERPLGPSVTATYGLPETFSKRFQKEALRRYFFNLRGHDFLSHNGQWQSSSREGHVDACANSYSEIQSLQALAEENAKGGKSTKLNISFGPLPGSFFADAVGLRRYRWNNLPASLDDKLQDLLSKRSIWSGSGYGTIHDVAINAYEGWILLLKRGKKYHWGGKLPQELREALQQGLEKKAAISRVFLNHQNPFEYVLLFSDGRTYASLHDEFQKPLEDLLTLWAKDRKLTKSFEYHFKASCYYNLLRQRVVNAAYYNKRGLFQISRGDPWLAFQYLREAHEQDRSSAEIHGNLGMALIAAREIKRDDQLEEYLALPVGRRPNQTVLKHGDGDLEGDFRMAYVGMATEGWNMDVLKDWLEAFRRANERTARDRDEAWSYRMLIGGGAKGSIFEVGGPRDPLAEGLVEMPGSRFDGRMYSHELR